MMLNLVFDMNYAAFVMPSCPSMIKKHSAVSILSLVVGVLEVR